MATNAEETAVDDSKITEDDLRNLKYDSTDVETSKDEDEIDETTESEESEEISEEDGQTDDQTEDEESEETSDDDSDEETSEFVKEFPNIKGDNLPEYARSLETAYKNSTAEALRLKGELDKLQAASQSEVDTTNQEDSGPVDPRLLYLDRMVAKDVQTTFEKFKQQYPQVEDPTEYSRFQDKVTSLSKFHLSEGQVATAEELYPEAAAILGWKPAESIPTSKEKLGMAIKNKATITKTTSATKRTPKSKVTDAMIAANRLMYPNKSDQEIREELEPYVN